MGLARELSMGPKRPRKPKPGQSPEFAALKRFTAAAAPDLEAFRAALEAVGTRPARLLYAEGMIYAAACARYTALTGEQYGPVTIDGKA